MTNTNTKHISNDPIEHSQHLESYIDYYKKLVAPGYAVLITGNWGSGKTHQITKLLKKNEYLYVSLFGAQSTEEIYSTIYAKMFPAKAFSKDLAGSTEGVAVGPIAVGGLVSKLVQAVIKDDVDPSKILVFDDLERSKLEINELFGIFNKYIEHHNCRVIVLAHDKKISNDLTSTKEKVFGQTIEIIPKTSEAFDSFILKLPNANVGSILSNLKDTILGIFEQSDTHSLRILKHSVEDLSRLLELLTDTHRAHDEAITALVSLILALSLEVRSGRLDSKSLEKRYDSIITHQLRSRNENLPYPPISLANKRYPSIELSNNLLKDQDLVNILIKGYYSQRDIRAALDESTYFSKIEDLPAWLAFTNFDIISDKESREAAEKMMQQFDQRSITKPGELLHLFSLRFLLSQMQLIDGDYDKVETDCRAYLDDLLNANKITAYLGNELMWGEDYAQSYNGYGYWVEENYKPHFQRILEHFKEAQFSAAKQKLPEYGCHLLKLLSTDGEKFAQEVSLTFGGGNTFASIPALSAIVPSDFVQEWMGSQPNNWRPISKGLEHRYNSGQLSGSLKPESHWIREVIRLMDIEKNKAKGIRKKRIERAINLSLRNAIASL